MGTHCCLFEISFIVIFLNCSFLYQIIIIKVSIAFINFIIGERQYSLKIHFDHFYLMLIYFSQYILGASIYTGFEIFIYIMELKVNLINRSHLTMIILLV